MINKIFKNKFFSSILLPFMLLAMWFLLTIIFNSEESISVLTYRMNNETDKIELVTKELLKGQKVNGEFIARDDNLGIISVRFNTFRRINDDVLTFRIKEKGRTNWFYENSHRVDQFQPDDFFTFGLPVISDSKGKTYQFQLESTKGIPKNAIAISNIEPIVVTKYQFTRSTLLTDKSLFMGHIYKKFLNTVFNPDYLLSSIIYLIPFSLYLLWILPKYNQKQVKSSRKSIKFNLHNFRKSLILILGCIIINIIFIRELSSIYAYIILFIAWLVFSIKYRLDSSNTFTIALIFLILCPLLFPFNKMAAERSIIWMYYFIVLGLLLNFRDLNTKIVLYDYKIVLSKYLK